MAFKRTAEQHMIVESVRDDSIDSIKVVAFAGTGKSTTLYEITNEFPELNFLYLIYNKSMQKEADKKFATDNAEARTTHSLAYKHTQDQLKLRTRTLCSSNQIYELQQVLKIKDYKKTLVVRSVFTAFCYSEHTSLSVETVDALLKADRALNSDALEAGLVKKYIFLYLKQLWLAIDSGKLDMPHDYYLKFFQINIEHYRKFLQYDVIMLDEAQDSNNVTLAIFTKLQGKKILVGDRYQAIYGWRKAINVMESITADKTFYLTNTFRFGENISSNANIVLSKFLGEEKEIVPFFKTKTGTPESKCIITRTNSGLIRELNDLNSVYGTTKVIKTVRNPKEIFKMPLSVLYYMTDKYRYKDKITEKKLWQFKSIPAMKEFAQDVRDVELIMAIKLAEDYDFKLEKLFDIAMENTRKRKVDIYLTTAHTSKGLEWDSVEVADDFQDLVVNLSNRKIKSLSHFKKLLKTDYDRVKDLAEEFNLFYVAITRGILDVKIMSENKKYLSMSEVDIDTMLKSMSTTIIRKK